MKQFYIIEKEHDPDHVVYENFPGSIRVIEAEPVVKLLQEAVDILKDAVTGQHPKTIRVNKLFTNALKVPGIK